jgi:alkylation response protein AidB-like acyl-CoA dehydrogenase
VSALLAALEPVARRAREDAARSEQARRLSRELAEEMARAGAFRMLVPECHGGLEVHPDEMIDALRLLGRADGAAGWCAMIGATTGLLAASLPQAGADAIFGADPDRITCGVTAPMGRARRSADGFRISGRWTFASGSANASWIMGGCLECAEDGTPEVDAAGNPSVLLAFFPGEAVQLHDSWHVSGLRGTGSGEFEVTDLEVPAAHCVPFGGRPRVDRPLYRFPTFGLLALGVAAVALGTAERALEELVALATEKVPAGGRRTLAQRGAIQADVARAEASLRSARAFMRDSVAAAWDAATAGERLATSHKADLRLAATHATWAAVDAVDRAYHAGGGSAIHDTSALQRCFRDVHVATQHVMVAQPVYELVGRVRLGLAPGGLL